MNNMAEIMYFKILLVVSSLLAVSGADPEVICVYKESCMLPCWFRIDSDPLIIWYKASAGDSVIHSYYNDQDQLGHHDQNFKDRTSLFLDQISKGNASLLLKEVKIQDEGRYKCYTSTTRGIEESFVNMKTEAPVSEVRIHREENRIICISEGIYPKPELTWSADPPSKTALENRTTVHQTEDQLYSISSSLMVSDNDPGLKYSCTVRTQRNSMTATYSKQGTVHQEGHSAQNGTVIGGVIAAVAVVVVVIGVVIYIKKERNKGGYVKSSVQVQHI